MGLGGRKFLLNKENYCFFRSHPGELAMYTVYQFGQLGLLIPKRVNLPAAEKSVGSLPKVPFAPAPTTQASNPLLGEGTTVLRLGLDLGLLAPSGHLVGARVCTAAP